MGVQIVLEGDQPSGDSLKTSCENRCFTQMWMSQCNHTGYNISYHITWKHTVSTQNILMCSCQHYISYAHHTKWPLFTMCPQMHPQGTRQFVRFLTHMTRKWSLITMSGQMCLQVNLLG